MAHSPDGGFITETNEQYYVGHQHRVASIGPDPLNPITSYTFTFDEVLEMADSALTPDLGSSWSPADPNFMLNNFDLMISTGGLNPYVLWDGTNGGVVPGAAPANGYGFRVSKFSNTQSWSTIEFFDADTGLARQAVQDGYYIQVRLKSMLVDGAPNYGDYQFVSLFDIVNNFMIGYVGEGKMIENVKRTDVMFHAKRGLQEFSYDTLRSVQSQEVTIPPTLSVIIPQDYVNYVQFSWIDDAGVKHIIYPTTLTSNPTETPIQDTNITTSNYGFSFPSEGYGIPTQDQFGENLEGTSLTDERWENIPPFDTAGVTPIFNQGIGDSYYGWRNIALLGQRYGLSPEVANYNGWFTINKREGKISFSSNLAHKLILFEYISDGLAYDEDTKISKLAEEALYMHIAYALIATRSNIPEYVVQRYKKDRRAALRNAKIRLSNIKPEEFVQIMRGKSKWIKH